MMITVRTKTNQFNDDEEEGNWKILLRRRRLQACGRNPVQFFVNHGMNLTFAIMTM